MNARERMLARLRAAAPATVPAAPDVGRHFAGRTAGDLLERARLLKLHLEAAHAKVMLATEAEWPPQLARLLADEGVRRLLVDVSGDAQRALIDALPSTIEPVAFERPIERWKDELFETMDAGFTVADAGLAATGTLVFASGPRAPRSTSLVPPLHVALIDAERIYRDMHAAAVGERWAEAMPSNLVMISGPSKTSDIQQTLAYGAHGPKELVVVIAVPGVGVHS